MGDFVSIIRPGGAKADLSAKQSVVDCLIRHPRVIGNRRWGMVHLYYRAGLSLREIGRVFGINRQMVSYELRKACRMVAAHLQACRDLEANYEQSE